MATINSVIKADGEVLALEDVTNFGRIKRFTAFTGEVHANFYEHDNPYGVEDVTKGKSWYENEIKKLNDEFLKKVKDIWQKEKSIADKQPKRASQPKEESKSEWEIVRYGYAQQQNSAPDIQYIDQVRRLSDGEMFSLNDEDRLCGKIEKFKVEDGLMWVQLQNGEIKNILELRKKLKQYD